MLTTLIFLLIVALVLYVVFYIASLFVQGVILKLIGAILALVWLVYALQKLGLGSF